MFCAAQNEGDRTRNARNTKPMAFCLLLAFRWGTGGEGDDAGNKGHKFRCVFPPIYLLMYCHGGVKKKKISVRRLIPVRKNARHKTKA